ncbi:TraB/GumN family protein [Robertmurraya yapensis]|uniref:TraB/GumN family protein n=2 Tax=Bacillaceae TaxID=186817 RepID=A0A3S0KI67_9BACI|nr:TraB/GumN family protein [Bacillus yapensis]RTR31403.1 TraB/GumN family protein [Bacillus yapensis]TKS95627.1 TraB/GumN family protein [Bacillus yapensis]
MSRSFKKLLLLSILFFLLAGCSINSKYGNTPSDHKLIAYKVENERGQHLYVLGTIHAGEVERYPFREEIESAFDESDYLAVEYDVTSTENAVMDMKANAIKDLNVSEDALTYLKKVSDTYPETVGGLTMSYDNLINYNAYTIQSLMLTATLSKLGHSLTYGIDYYFLDKAKHENKEIVEMEGAKFHVDLMQEFNKSYTEFLLKNLLPLQDSVSSYEKASQFVLEGDIESIIDATYPKNDNNREQGYYEAFLFDRNDRMTELAKEYIASGDTYFIAVGAGHVIGERGIIHQLEQQGYKITRL